MKFNDTGALPTSVRLSEFDEGAGIEAAFNAHNAKWHKSCRNLYNKTKLDRALTRRALVSEGNSVADNINECLPVEDSDMESTVDYFTRSSLSTSSVNFCFFCNKSEKEGCGKLHQVTTLEVDARVRRCAHMLNDCTLIANLSAGDMIALEAKYHAVCLVSLYKKSAAFERNELYVDDADVSAKHSLAFAQSIYASIYRVPIRHTRHNGPSRLPWLTRNSPLDSWIVWNGDRTSCGRVSSRSS